MIDGHMVIDPTLGELTLHSELVPRRVLTVNLIIEPVPHSHCRVLRFDLTSEHVPHSQCLVLRVDLTSEPVPHSQSCVLKVDFTGEPVPHIQCRVLSNFSYDTERDIYVHVCHSVLCLWMMTTVTKSGLLLCM